ncbi:hypothetical protein FRC07_009689, partial [Ceratobasidium sp. 392]
MHHDQISEDIFRFAVVGLGGEGDFLPPTDQEMVIERTTTRLLKNFTRLVDGSWDKTAFLRIIENLTSYSLLAYDPTNRCYSVHPLVQQWTRSRVTDPDAICSCVALLLASSVTREPKAEDFALRRMLLNHVDNLPKNEILRPRLAGRFRLVYHEAGRIKDEEILLNEEHKANVDMLGSEHPKTLANLEDLAKTFLRQMRWTEAERLQRQVLDTRRRVHGNEHFELLRSLRRLAR